MKEKPRIQLQTPKYPSKNYTIKNYSAGLTIPDVKQGISTLKNRIRELAINSLPLHSKELILNLI